MHRFLNILCCCLIFFTSCATSDKKQIESSPSLPLLPSLNPNDQIGEYIIEIFEDSNGNLWFGTLSNGVAKYDGEHLRFYSEKDGLSYNDVVSIVEDDNDILWFGTQNGLSSFDGKNFTNYLMNISDDESRISCLHIDSKGLLWIGTWDGVELPIPDVFLEPYQTTMKWVSEIKESENGNIWICRDGYGIVEYDRQEFRTISKKDGLLSNNARDVILADNKLLWAASRVVERDAPGGKPIGDGGIVKFTKEGPKYFEDLKGLFQADVYCLYENPDETVWVSTIQDGLYRIKLNDVTNYQFEGNNKPIQSMLQDSKGNLWIGCSGGLFKLENNEIVNYPQGKFM